MLESVPPNNASALVTHLHLSLKTIYEIKSSKDKKDHPPAALAVCHGLQQGGIDSK